MNIYCETDELPKPKANKTQEKIGLKAAVGPTCFPQQNIFVDLGLVSAQTP